MLLCQKILLYSDSSASSIFILIKVVNTKQENPVHCIMYLNMPQNYVFTQSGGCSIIIFQQDAAIIECPLFE